MRETIDKQLSGETGDSASREIQRYPLGPFVVAIDTFQDVRPPIASQLNSVLTSHGLSTTTLLIEQQQNFTPSVQKSVSQCDFIICDQSPLGQWSRRKSEDTDQDQQRLDQSVQRMDELGINTLFVFTSESDPASRERYEQAVKQAKQRTGLSVIEIPSLSTTPEVQEIVGSTLRPVAQDIFELKELVRLEKRHDIGDILRTNPVVTRADGTMLHWLVNTMLHASSSEDAISKWRAKSHRGGRISERDFSYVQKSILQLPDEHIDTLFTQTEDYIQTTAPHVKERVVNRVARWNKGEKREEPIRSLELLRENGINIHIEPTDVSLIQQEYSEEAAFLVLDRIKNKKIATINGLTDSKMSLSIHDTFDHFLTYDKLERMGILDRYSEFLQSVGNPQDTDLFNKEGELIASICFEWRSSHTPERQFKPLLSLPQIQRVFEKTDQQGLSINQERAAGRLSDLPEEGEEATRLCSMYSGILVEFMEQRRKHGYIRQMDSTNEAGSVLPLLEPEYLALIVEVNHMLCDPATRSREDLFSTEAIIEDYLIALARGETDQDLSITLPAIQNFDVSSSRLSEKRQQWLRENPFHAATRVMVE